MSVHLSSRVWKLNPLDPATKLVLLKLADNANDEGVCWPSLQRIADETGLDRTTVCRKLKKLEELLWIRREHRKQKSTRYQLTIPDSGSQPPLVARGHYPSGTESPPPVAVSHYPSGLRPPESSLNHQLNHQLNRQPLTVPQGEQGSVDSIESVEEAKKLICSEILHGKDPARPWSYEAMQELARLLPIPKREIKLLGWFHRLADDDDGPALRNRRRSETTLMKFWSDEVTRAAAYRKKIGPGPGEILVKKEPALWREFFKWKYGEDCVVPALFEALPWDQKREWKAEHEEWEKANPVTAAKEMIRKEAA